MMKHASDMLAIC